MICLKSGRSSERPTMPASTNLSRILRAVKLLAALAGKHPTQSPREFNLEGFMLTAAPKFLTDVKNLLLRSAADFVPLAVVVFDSRDRSRNDDIKSAGCRISEQAAECLLSTTPLATESLIFLTVTNSCSSPPSLQETARAVGGGAPNGLASCSRCAIEQTVHLMGPR